MTEESKVISGKIYVLGDNIDTDQIIPAEYLNLVPTIPEEYELLGSHALAGLPDECPDFLVPGSSRSEARIVIAGDNFGCGSSREHAPIALGAAGIAAVVAQSYARIFFRNAIATGELYPLESVERLCDVVNNGDEVSVDLAASTLTTVADGKTHALKPLGAVAPVIAAGGIFGYARATGMIAAEQQLSIAAVAKSLEGRREVPTI